MSSWPMPGVPRHPVAGSRRRGICRGEHQERPCRRCQPQRPRGRRASADGEGPGAEPGRLLPQGGSGGLSVRRGAGAEQAGRRGHVLAANSLEQHLRRPRFREPAGELLAVVGQHLRRHAVSAYRGGERPRRRILPAADCPCPPPLTAFDCEHRSLYSEHCSSELNSVHLSGVLPGRRAAGPARCKGRTT
jgi:hypothetical protein